MISGSITRSVLVQKYLKKSEYVRFLGSGATSYAFKIVDPDQVLHSAAADQGLHCSPLVQLFLDKLAGSKMDMFKF